MKEDMKEHDLPQNNLFATVNHLTKAISSQIYLSSR